MSAETASPPLFGHDAAVSAFREAIESGRMHHAWLIAGPEGIGKALFARKAALRLLADGDRAGLPGIEIDEEHPAASLFRAGSHPDLKLLERLPRDDKLHEKPRSEWPDDAPLARSISIDQVRRLQRLFGTTASISRWRVVIVDSIDDLERAAANALLKNLEEPPTDSLFLLVSHAPDRLLPTIRSRCRTLRLSTLDDEAMTSALTAALPDAKERELRALAEAGQGSPGRAIAFRGLDIGGLDETIDTLIETGDPSNSIRSKLAHSLGLKAAQPRYEAFLTRVPQAIAGAARRRKGAALEEAIQIWERARRLTGSAVHLSLEPQGVVFELGGMLAALAHARD